MEKSHTGKVTWRSPSNIALVKYWGKKGFQLPANASLSMTLNRSYTETSVAFSPAAGKGSFEFYFDGKQNEGFRLKLEKYFSRLGNEFPWLNRFDLEIYSKNTFPHSAGIASSASAMSALALCLCSIHQEVGKNSQETDFYKHASHIARIGSGSAARSVFGGFTSWGETDLIAASSDGYASKLDFKVDPVFENMHDSILIVHSGEKKISSRVGHDLMERHDYAEARYRQARKNMKELLQVLKNGDSGNFVRIVEHEALSLHAMMMASDPGYVLLDENTLKIIEKIRHYRKQNYSALCFTLDAGPNVHVLFPETENFKAKSFIDNELKPFCENGQIIHDMMGRGPERILDNE
ncbi:MAG: diphosphomevalonate decarboxylase [Bacteroidales bacterium]